MVHAGLLPQWNITKALQLAHEVETALRGKHYRNFLQKMYGNRPDRWNESLTGYDRLRVIVNAMTRLRLCSTDGAMEFNHKGQLKALPSGYVPWFAAPGRRSRDTPIICGHWSALGLQASDNLFALDTGCLWGRRLTGLRIEDRKIFQISCRGLAGLKRQK